MSIVQILEKNKKALLSIDGVVAVGIGFKESKGEKTAILSIVCSVVKKKSLDELSAKDIIPSSINGLPTDVQETGRIKVLTNTQKHRPAPGAVSIGHYSITAGTLGCVVKKDGRRVILSNNHVLANSNDAEIGDAIYQPGPYDGGTANETIATLLQFVPINFSGIPSDCPTGNTITAFFNLFAYIFNRKTRLQAVIFEGLNNKVDAAIALPLNDEDISDEILKIGFINAVVDAGLGTKIKKNGRTTDLTTGEIQQINVTANVQYGEGKVATFEDQILAGPISQGGDSGSAVFDENNNLVGLLFAGSDTVTIMNRSVNVFNELGLSL
jgi:hypothetical protein